MILSLFFEKFVTRAYLKISISPEIKRPLSRWNATCYNIISIRFSHYTFSLYRKIFTDIYTLRGIQLIGYRAKFKLIKKKFFI